jgi:hypothetical protein
LFKLSTSDAEDDGDSPKNRAKKQGYIIGLNHLMKHASIIQAII